MVDGWDVRQRHGGPDAEVVNAAVLADLEGGATSILLGPVPDLGLALRGVLLDLAPVCLDWGADAARGVARLIELWEAAGMPPSAAAGEAGLDPLGRLADDPTDDLEAGLAEAVDWCRRFAATYPQVRGCGSTPPATARPVPATPRRSPWPWPAACTTCGPWSTTA